MKNLNKSQLISNIVIVFIILCFFIGNTINSANVVANDENSSNSSLVNENNNIGDLESDGPPESTYRCRWRLLDPADDNRTRSLRHPPPLFSDRSHPATRTCPWR